MIFTRVLALLSAALLAVAGDVSTIPASQCNTGSISCCTQTLAATPETLSEYDLLGLDVPLDLLLGLGCTLDILGQACEANQEPVCCSGVSQNGLVNFGCSPVNLNL